MNFIEKYIAESGDSVKQQLDTFNRWIKENDYHRHTLIQCINKLLLELKRTVHEMKELKKYRKLLKKEKK